MRGTSQLQVVSYGLQDHDNTVDGYTLESVRA